MVHRTLAQVDHGVCSAAGLVGFVYIPVLRQSEPGPIQDPECERLVSEVVEYATVHVGPVQPATYESCEADEEDRGRGRQAGWPEAWIQ